MRHLLYTSLLLSCTFAVAQEAAIEKTYVQAKVRHTVSPQFPEAAKRAGINQAECTAEVWITPRGRSETVEVAGCEAYFHPEVRNAIMQWRWEPHHQNGKPVSALTKVQIAFEAP